ncbi:uncharacterized protein [Drosophila kikkawai]|uniref:Uncharacterized protein LOC108073699 n=1 Tax=Drosophila kikkawai TaxID=30033 RepID=A0A6P4IEH4_DROKI|nr:uncharacterized protein LOC108073699 [Drosophila kikkawai]XP_017020922.1 uncharacterized protein LOC108073699 [Drosophila kikkawai]XP_017020923.1 uncharacterized protein LOC108073699 [Drosophila kikkawai]
MPTKNKNNAHKSQVSVPKLSQPEIEYVINDVVANVRQDFLDDGPGEQALRLLLHTWCSKLMASQLPNDSQGSKEKDKNSNISPGLSSLFFEVKQEGDEEPVYGSDHEPKKGVFMEMPLKKDEAE